MKSTSSRLSSDLLFIKNIASIPHHAKAVNQVFEFITIMSDQTLKGKVAIISGSSSGIGAGIVRELSARGAFTVVNFPFPHLEDEARRLVSSLPSPSIAVEADMSTVSAPRKLVDTAVSQWGKIDIVVNCAGLAVNKPFEEQTLADWDLLVNVNGRGTFLLTQASLPHLTRGNGRIVNIVSISARGPPPNQTIYAGTKGMCDSFTKCWSVISYEILVYDVIVLTYNSAGPKSSHPNTVAQSTPSAPVRP
jgi:NAD(P)-dependent dehydrogenase (short-subunit alcohol dehydrogenase family)